MKSTILTLLVVFSAVVCPAPAQDAAEFAAMKATVEKLERQNQTLRLAVEAIAGKPIEQIVGVVSAPAIVAPSPAPAPPSERLILGVPETQARARLAQLEGQLKAMNEAHSQALQKEAAGNDPFAGGSGSGIKKSAADLKKAAELRITEIARVKAQADTLRQALAN